MPGIGYSPDRMLQGRLFSYGDTQRYRLGVNHGQLPVNRPKPSVNTTHRDGSMRTDDNGGENLNYAPPNHHNSYVPSHDAEPALRLEREALHFNFRDYDDDYYSQPGNLFRLMAPDQQQRLIGNIVASMSEVDNEQIKKQQVEHFLKTDKALGIALAKGLSIKID